METYIVHLSHAEFGHRNASVMSCRARAGITAQAYAAEELGGNPEDWNVGTITQPRCRFPRRPRWQVKV